MTRIQSLYPLARYGSAPLTNAEVLGAYEVSDRTAPLLRANFVSSVDGSATVDGLSGPLGGPADRLVFDGLRRLTDVVLVGAGTVRAEGYGAMRLSDEDARWRADHGLAEQPVFAIVSGRLDLDPASDVFTKAPVRPIVLSKESASDLARDSLSAVADVVDCGTTTVEPSLLVAALVERGLPQILCEGGPSLFGSLLLADVVDELCLTVSPLLEGGSGIRIARETIASPPRDMTLVHVLESDGLLLTRYQRRRD
jgi:riboflavin biosynthesis pyrimidine reductase